MSFQWRILQWYWGFPRGEKTSISIACEGATLAHLIEYLKNSELFGWDDMAHWD
jgi:hypothetical protein